MNAPSCSYWLMFVCHNMFVFFNKLLLGCLEYIPLLKVLNYEQVRENDLCPKRQIRYFTSSYNGKSRDDLSHRVVYQSPCSSKKQFAGSDVIRQRSCSFNRSMIGPCPCVNVPFYVNCEDTDPGYLWLLFAIVINRQKSGCACCFDMVYAAWLVAL